MLALRRHSTVLFANLKSSQVHSNSVLATTSRVVMASTSASSSSVVPPEGRADATVYANGVGQIVLNRPAALNALSIDMVKQIAEHLERWSTDPAVRAVLFTAAGPKAFCAGGDVRLLATVADYPEQFLRHEYRMNHTISNYLARHGKPIVSLISGIVMGGGVGVSMHGTHRVCTDSTMFAMPETTIGFFPDVGGTYLLPRLKGANLPRAAGSVGLYLGTTGARVRAGSDLLLSGIGTHFVPNTSWAALVAALRQESLGADAARAVSALLERFHELPSPVAAAPSAAPAPGAKATSEAAVPMFTTDVLALLESCFGSHILSIDAALAQLDAVAAGTVVIHVPRAAGNASSAALGTPEAGALLRMQRTPLDAQAQQALQAFAAKTAKDLRAKSPLALKVTWRALRENAKKDLGAALQTEFRLGVRMTAQAEFKEGVRALLIDKDNKPRWAPAELTGVSDAQLDSLFCAFGAGEPAELALPSVHNAKL